MLRLRRLPPIRSLDSGDDRRSESTCRCSRRPRDKSELDQTSQVRRSRLSGIAF